MILIKDNNTSIILVYGLAIRYFGHRDLRPNKINYFTDILHYLSLIF